ncbi:DUF5011 domain-containing protein [Mycoplasmatota bacterium WC44]
MKRIVALILSLLMIVDAHALGGGSTGGVEVIESTHEETVYSTGSDVNVTLVENGVIILGTEDGKVHALFIDESTTFITPISIGSSISGLSINGDDLLVSTTEGTKTIEEFVSNVIIPLKNGTYSESNSSNSSNSSGGSSSSSGGSSGGSSGSSTTAGAPTVTLVGDLQTFVEIGTEYIDEGVIAIDYVGSVDITDTVVVEGLEELDVNTLGTYWLTYIAQGSITTGSTKRRVDVVDTTPPIIEFNDGDVVNIELNTEYIDPGFTITDNYDQSLTIDDVLISGGVDTSSLSTQFMTYTVSDSQNNEITFKKIINVVLDTTPPLLKLNGSEEEYIEKDSIYIDKGVNVSDKFSTETIIEGNVDTKTVGIYELVYKVTDLSGNVSEINRFVNVKETVVKYVEVNINNGFDEMEMKISSIKLDIDGTISKYIVSDSKSKPTRHDSRWQSFNSSIEVQVVEPGMYLQIMICDVNEDFEIFTSDELKYENTTSVVTKTATDTNNRLVVKTNGKEKSEEKTTDVLEKEEVFSEEILKVQTNEDGSTTVAFDLRETSEYHQMMVYYRIKTTSKSMLMVSVSADDGWQELIIEEGEIETVKIQENQELEFKTELAYKDETKELEVTEFLIANDGGEILVNVVTDSDFNGLLYLPIGIILGLSIALTTTKLKRRKA